MQTQPVSEATLGECLYSLASATAELLGTLAAHGAAAELRAVGLLLDGTGGGDGGGDGDASLAVAAVNARGGREEGVRGTAGAVGGGRWVTEIAVGVGGSDGGRGGGWGAVGGARGRGVEILEACWAVSRDVDGVRGEKGMRGDFGGVLGVFKRRARRLG